VTPVASINLLTKLSTTLLSSTLVRLGFHIPTNRKPTFLLELRGTAQVGLRWASKESDCLWGGASPVNTIFLNREIACLSDIVCWNLH
jgi:hypothetical protein